MRTVLVELRDSNALRLLKDLELAKIIKVLDRDKTTDKKNLSANLRGAISKERANRLNEQLNQMRDEWETRDF